MLCWIISIGRGALGVLILLELGLTSHVISLKDKDAGPFIFIIINSISSLLLLAFIIITPLIGSYAHHNLVSIVVLASAAMAWLVGSIVVAAVRDPSGELDRLSITPIVALSFFIWAVFTLLASLEVFGLLKGAYRSDVVGLVELDGTEERGRYLGAEAV